MIRGEKICLRPVTRADLLLLDAHANDVEFNSEYNNFGFTPDQHLTSIFERDGLLSPGMGTLVVLTLDDQFVGSVSYHITHYGPNSGSSAYNIGIELEPGHRGKGYGVEAQKLLAQYLFMTYPIRRVEASTDVENIPEQRALEKAGFSRDGILRQAQWRNGQWHDLMVYSKLRGE
jgi:RimJ/RimL family protein N-acetyltransferase